MKLEKFIRKQKVAFIAGVDESGYPTIKAMLMPRKIVGIKEFYFSTNTSSKRVNDYLKNDKASIYFYSMKPFNYQGLMLTGNMEVVTDEKVKEELWSPGDKIYYPKGKNDPDYCILKFTSLNGRHYHNLKHEEIEIGE